MRPRGGTGVPCRADAWRPGGETMTFSVHGLAVARGIAIGRAVLMASSRVDVAHYFIQPGQVADEIARVRAGRNAVVEEIHRLQQTIARWARRRRRTSWRRCWTCT